MLYYVIEILWVMVIAILGISMASVSTSRTTFTPPTAPVAVAAAPAAAAIPTIVEEEVIDFFKDDCCDMAALYIKMCHDFEIVHEIVYSSKPRKIVEADDDITIGHLVVPFARSYQWQYMAPGDTKWVNATMEDNDTSCVIIDQNIAGVYRCVVHTDKHIFIGNELEIR